MKKIVQKACKNREIGFSKDTKKTPKKLLSKYWFWVEKYFQIVKPMSYSDSAYVFLLIRKKRSSKKHVKIARSGSPKILKKHRKKLLSKYGFWVEKSFQIAKPMSYSYSA